MAGGKLVGAGIITFILGGGAVMFVVVLLLLIDPVCVSLPCFPCARMVRCKCCNRTRWYALCIVSILAQNRPSYRSILLFNQSAVLFYRPEKVKL